MYVSIAQNTASYACHVESIERAKKKKKEAAETGNDVQRWELVSYSMK